MCSIICAYFCHPLQLQKSMSLYRRQKEHVWAEDGEKLKVMSECLPNSDQENENVEDDKTEKMCPADDMQGIEGALPNLDIEVDPKNGVQKAESSAETLEQKIDIPVGITTEKSEDPVSALEHVNTEVNSVLDLGPQEHDVEEMPLSAESVEGSDTLLPSEVKDMPSNNEEVKLVDTKCDPLLNSDMFSEASEAMMPESMVPGSVNLSRIHHSPESTH